MEQKYFYVVLFVTPYNTGKFIRLMTGYPYNHGAISFSEKITNVYSFARRYKSTPFYAGFVTESILRYNYKGDIAKVKIFKIPVTEQQLSGVMKRVEDFKKEPLEYIYNFASAMLFPLKRSVKIFKAYTCIEFVLSILRDFTDIPTVKGCEFISVKGLDEALRGFELYEGSAEPFLKNGDWTEDPFEKKKSFFFGVKNTLALFCKLFVRLIKN